jgi:hypothetical protein
VLSLVCRLVLSLLALLVQKYKYRHLSSCELQTLEALQLGFNVDIYQFTSFTSTKVQILTPAGLQTLSSLEVLQLGFNDSICTFVLVKQLK